MYSDEENPKKKTFRDWLFDNFGISYWQIWSDFFSHVFGDQKFNWHTFSIIDLEIDWEAYLGQVTFTFELLGCGIRYQHSYKPLHETKGGSKLLGRMRDISEGIMEEVDLGKTSDGKYDIKCHPGVLEDLEKMYEDEK